MKNITKTFGSVIANDKVNLDIYKGEILSLLGENGSGKTTLIKMLNGLLTPTEGTILIDGNNVGPATKSKVAYLLGNFIELVVVATGFEGDAQPGVMKQIIPPARTVEPAVKETSAAAPVLEPIKPLPPKPAQRQPELVMLGAKPTRYSNIDTLLAKPAYQSRNSKFIVRVPGSRKEVLKDDTTDAQAQKEESQGGSLFD